MGLQLRQTHRKRRRVSLDWAHGEGKITQAVLHVEPKLCLGSQALGASDPLTTPGPQLHFTWPGSAQCSKRTKLQITGWIGQVLWLRTGEEAGPRDLGEGMQVSLRCWLGRCTIYKLVIWAEEEAEERACRASVNELGMMDRVAWQTGPLLLMQHPARDCGRRGQLPPQAGGTGAQTAKPPVSKCHKGGEGLKTGVGDGAHTWARRVQPSGVVPSLAATLSLCVLHE